MHHQLRLFIIVACVIFIILPFGLLLLQAPWVRTLLPVTPHVSVSSPCLYTNGTLVGLGYSSTANGGDTLKWEIGYTKGTAWVQTQGGDAYASGTMRSYIPAVSPRVFNRDYLILREQLFANETVKSLYKQIEEFQKKKTGKK